VLLSADGVLKLAGEAGADDRVLAGEGAAIIHVYIYIYIYIYIDRERERERERESWWGY
jgi:hypothetical protein